jgi:hypothetical protein
MKNNDPIRTTRRGISLIEGVLYLVLALSVIVGGIVFFQQAQLSNNVTNTSRTMTGISSQVRGIYLSTQNYGPDGTDLTETVLAAGGVPSNFIDNNGTAGDSTDDRISHPFEGNIEVYSEDGGSGAVGSRYFVIEMENLGEAECIRLSTLSPAGDGPLGTNMVALGILPGVAGTAGVQDSAALASDLATPVAAAFETATMHTTSLSQVAPGIGINSADATLVCAEEHNTVFGVYID